MILSACAAAPQPPATTPATTPATCEITGTVMDKATRRPAGGATVVLAATEETKFADDAGRFAFMVAPAQHTFRIYFGEDKVELAVGPGDCGKVHVIEVDTSRR